MSRSKGVPFISFIEKQKVVEVFRYAEDYKPTQDELAALRRILIKTNFDNERFAEWIYEGITILEGSEIHKDSILKFDKRRLNLCKALLIFKTSMDITIKGENGAIKLDSLWKQRIESELERAFDIREEMRTIEHIQDRIRRIEKRIEEYPKAEGAPVKNLKAIIAVDLFQSWKQDTYKQNLTNKDCRTIFEVLNFFGLIDKGLIECWEASAKKSYPEIQYVKSLAKQAGNYTIEWIVCADEVEYEDDGCTLPFDISDYHISEEGVAGAPQHDDIDPYDLYMNK